MDSLKFLNQKITIKIDRPIGSSHPKYPDLFYPVNYGYVPNTISGDNEELDCYVLGVYKPLVEFTGICIAIIHRLEGDDDKLIIVPENETFSNTEIRALTHFQERFFKSEIIRPQNYLEFSKNIPELTVTNLENSLNFYQTIGFKVEYTRPENKFAFLSLNDEIQFMIQENSGSEKWDIAPLAYPFGNGINFQIEVYDISKIYNNLKKSGYKITFEIEENWYRQDNKLLGNEEFLVQDPDGYLLRFSEDLGVKEI